MIVSLVLVLGGAAAVRALASQLAKAPEGFEDESGFHFVTRGSRLRTRRLARRRCVTAPAAGLRSRALQTSAVAAVPDRDVTVLAP